jgi:hypothetical protein
MATSAGRCAAQLLRRLLPVATHAAIQLQNPCRTPDRAVPPRPHLRVCLTVAIQDRLVGGQVAHGTGWSRRRRRYRWWLWGWRRRRLDRCADSRLLEGLSIHHLCVQAPVHLMIQKLNRRPGHERRHAAERRVGHSDVDGSGRWR